MLRDIENAKSAIEVTNREATKESEDISRAFPQYIRDVFKVLKNAGQNNFLSCAEIIQRSGRKERKVKVRVENVVLK